jgi:hypothetical protein
MMIPLVQSVACRVETATSGFLTMPHGTARPIFLPFALEMQQQRSVDYQKFLICGSANMNGN